jgi:alkylation response protein AidB-like acyl-CoA dehydrogenase
MHTPVQTPPPTKKESHESTSHDARRSAVQPVDPAALDAVSLILKQAGRSADEVASLAALDAADRAAEHQFSGAAPTLTSLFGTVRAADFYAGRFRPSPEVAKVMGESMEFLLQRKKAGTLLDHGKMLFHDDTISGLARIGFFGLAIPKAYGGSGALLGDLGPMLRALTLIHPDMAVMFEVHNFLGPVTPILDFGTEEQKQYYLPKMAKGELLGSFALTEPGVGADPSKLACTARRDGNRYLISGVKWPITNVIYGGLCILVVKLEGEGLPRGRDTGMLLFEVPKSDTPNFRMIRNRLVAFDYLWNARFRLMDFEMPTDSLLGPPGKGLAQAFSSLAKGRGGICVNSAAKIFKLLAQIIRDPSDAARKNEAGATPTPDASGNGSRYGAQQKPASVGASSKGGWTAFRSTFGKPIGESPRIQTWVGRAVCHGLASRVLGDLCFRLGANGVRDETQGMIAKVFATKALLQTAINVYQIQGGRSVHTDERREALRRATSATGSLFDGQIENFIGENMHEFTIATVYEGPNPVLADIGAPNAMTREIRAKYLEPIGMAELEGKTGLLAKARFGWFLMCSVLGSFSPSIGSLEGVSNLFPEKERLVLKALRRNRILGRNILMIIARFQTTFMDQSFLLGDEGGVFDRLCHSVAALVYALSLEKPDPEYLVVADALDCEAELIMKGKTRSAELQSKWASVGQLIMRHDSKLHHDLLSDVEVSDIPLDPRYVERYI